MPGAPALFGKRAHLQAHQESEDWANGYAFLTFLKSVGQFLSNPVGTTGDAVVGAFAGAQSAFPRFSEFLGNTALNVADIGLMLGESFLLNQGNLLSNIGLQDTTATRLLNSASRALGQGSKRVESYQNALGDSATEIVRDIKSSNARIYGADSGSSTFSVDRNVAERLH